MSSAENEYVLVTGASSGIGRETAVRLSAHYNIILHGRNEERLAQTAAMCSQDHKILSWIYDLCDAKGLEEALIKFIQENNIAVVKFVHCAGMMKVLPLKSVSLDYTYDVLNTNVIAAALIVKVLSHFKHNKSRLNNAVFISSNISNMGAKAFSTYGMSKGALDALMRCLAIELAPKVRVNSVLPGGIETEMTKEMNQDKELVSRMEATYPLGLGKPGYIADAVKFLLSDEASWITGQQITVDGGRTINISG